MFVFALAMVNVVIAFEGVDSQTYYTSWDFHECYARTLNTLACPTQYGFYAYYPPLVAVVSNLINLKLFFFLAIAGFLLYLGLAADNWLAPVWFWTIGANWVTTAVMGGILPFFLIMLYIVVTVYYWGRMRAWQIVALILLALFTHNLAGWFFAVVVLALHFLGKELGVKALLVGSLAVLLFSLVFLSSPDVGGWGWRPIYMVLLFASLLFGQMFNSLMKKINSTCGC